MFCGHLLNPSLKGIVVGIIRGRGSFLDPSTVASKELVKYSDQLCKLVGASSFFPPLFLVDESIADESRGDGGGGGGSMWTYSATLKTENLHGLCGISQSAHEEEGICWSMQRVLLLVVLVEKQLPEFTE